jgi:hypothetical protein
MPIIAMLLLATHISGVVVDHNGAVLRGMTIIGHTEHDQRQTSTDESGRFALEVPEVIVSLNVEGQYIEALEKILSSEDQTDNLRIEVEYRIPAIHQSVVITASALQPQVETHSDEAYKRTLFSRDDQLLETLNAGINAGQHEGGGKSLEIRRFGFNLDHGGLNGGLKVLVDDVQQNQGTQGHGQGYLGALKTLTPELIQARVSDRNDIWVYFPFWRKEPVSKSDKAQRESGRKSINIPSPRTRAETVHLNVPSGMRFSRRDPANVPATTPTVERHTIGHKFNMPSGCDTR